MEKQAHLLSLQGKGGLLTAAFLFVDAGWYRVNFIYETSGLRRGAFSDSKIMCFRSPGCVDSTLRARISCFIHPDCPKGPSSTGLDDL